MRVLVGLDVSPEKTRIYMISENGKMVTEAQVASEPEALLRLIGDQDGEVVWTGASAGRIWQALWGPQSATLC